jgi:hypothetical protein
MNFMNVLTNSKEVNTSLSFMKGLIYLLALLHISCGHETQRPNETPTADVMVIDSVAADDDTKVDSSTVTVTPAEPDFFLPFSDTPISDPKKMYKDVARAMKVYEDSLQAFKIDAKNIDDANNVWAEIFWQNNHVLKIEYYTDWAHNGTSTFYYDRQGRIRYIIDHAHGLSWENMYYTYISSDGKRYAFNTGGELPGDGKGRRFEDAAPVEYGDVDYHNMIDEETMAERLLKIAKRNLHKHEGTEYYKGDIYLNQAIIIEVRYGPGNNVSGKYRTKGKEKDIDLKGFVVGERLKLTETTPDGAVKAEFSWIFKYEDRVQGSYIEHDKRKNVQHLLLDRTTKYQF